jgi:hypothetical protein
MKHQRTRSLRNIQNKRTNNTRSKSNKVKTRKNKLNIIVGGANYREIYKNNDIDNIEVLTFLVGLLNNPDFRNKVIMKNQNYLNSITSENIGESFNYSQNQSYRIFINDIIQWLLLDYNQDFFNSVLDVLLKCFKRTDFLNNSDPFNILLQELDNKINEKNMDTGSVNTVTLLKIILEVLTTIPSITISVSNLLTSQKEILLQYSSSIICILNYLIQQDIKTNQGIRNLIQNYFKNMKLDLLGVIIPALKLVTSCSGSVASNYFSNYSLFGKKTAPPPPPTAPTII